MPFIAQFVRHCVCVNLYLSKITLNIFVRYAEIFMQHQPKASKYPKIANRNTECFFLFDKTKAQREKKPCFIWAEKFAFYIKQAPRERRLCTELKLDRMHRH